MGNIYKDYSLLQITLVFKMCNYTSAFLRSIRKTSRTDFSNFQLSHILMSSIVALGLKKQPRDRPYRMSRAESRLFHYIKTIVSKKKTETIEEIQFKGKQKQSY